MKKGKFLFFLLAWVGMLLYFSQRWILGPLIPSLIHDFSSDRTQLGMVSAASMWGYMFTPIIAGLLSDRFGRKYAVLLGIFGFSAFTAASGLAGSINQLFAARLVTGMFEGFYFIPLIAFMLELFPERPGFYLTLMTSGASLGWFAGPALSGLLLDVTGTWRTAFILTGAAGLVVACVLSFTWPQQQKVIRTGTFFNRDILKPVNLSLLFLLCLTAAFQTAAEFGFTMWFPVFLKTEMGTTATLAGLIAGMYGVGQFIGRPVFGAVADRVGYRLQGTLGSFLFGLSLVLVLRIDGYFLKALFCFGAGFVGASVMGSLWTFTGLVYPAYKGLSLGIITTFCYVVASAAPISIGYIGDHYSVALGLWLIAVPCAFLSGAVFALTRLVRRFRAGDQ
jgi:MFS family permease